MTCLGAQLSAEAIGETGGEHLSFNGETISVAELKDTHESWLPDYMAAVE